MGKILGLHVDPDVIRPVDLQLLVRAALVVAAVADRVGAGGAAVPVDDVEFACVWIEPNAWDAVAIAAAVVAGCGHV